MGSVCDSLDALLASARDANLSYYGDDDDEMLSLEDHQARLCQRLLQSLEKQSMEHTNARPAQGSSPDSVASKEEDSQPRNFIHTSIDYNNKRKSKSLNKRRSSFSTPPLDVLTVREVFADSGSSASNLPPLLASLMMNRVDTDKLLPPTQDAQANEDAMNSVSALTLTKPALIATELYAKLLAMPGAYGSGLIEMEAVSALAALFRRWRLECVASIDLLVNDNQNKANKKKKVPKQKKTGKRKSSHKKKDANPTKRGRRNPKRAVNFDLNSEEETEEEPEQQNEDEETDEKPKAIENMLDDNENEDGIISPEVLIMFGLKAALAMSGVPLQKDFMSWSSESREAIIDAVTSLYGTVCALVTPSVEPKLVHSIVLLQTSVVARATNCLKQCILLGGSPSDNDGDNEDDTGSKTSVSAKRHGTAVFIFRGLFPIMSMQESLPNGETGKQIACEKVAETVQGFVQRVAEDMADKNSLWTPAASVVRRSSVARRASVPVDGALNHSAATPKTTSKKGRKKRVSFGGVDSQKTPLLKSGKKATQPGSAISTPGQHLEYMGTKPRPVLSAVLGLLQKLATTKGLEKANLRGCIVKSIHTCLCYLPSLERSFFLRFLNQLCLSKVAVHRLLAAELLGLLLTEPWLWNDHIGQPIDTPKPQSQNGPKTPSRSASFITPTSHGEQSALTPVLEQGDMDLPSSLLESLKGRLTDKSPVVRTRAAGSLSDLMKNMASIMQSQDKENEESFLKELCNCLSNNGYHLLHILRKRAVSDEKASVRKASIGALVELLLLGHFSEDFHFGIGDEEITSLGQLCRDTSMPTRKAAAQGLTTLLERCTSSSEKNNENTANQLQRTWATSVLPLALDSETACVAKAVELVNQIVIQPITLDDDSDLFDRRFYNTAWNILSFICENSGSGKAKGETEALKAALTKLTASDASNKDINRALLRRICDVAVFTLEGTTEELCEPGLECQRSGVWCLFDALVDQAKDLTGLYSTLKKLKIDLDFLGTSWKKMLQLLETPTLPLKSGSLLRACMRSCLRLLSKLASCVDPKVARQSGENLHSMLTRFTLPADLIGSAVSALAATSIVCSGSTELDVVRSDCKERIVTLFEACEDAIASYAKPSSDTGLVSSDEAEEAAVRAIFTVGEVAIVGFSPDEDDDTKRGQNKKNGGATESDPLRGLNVQPSKHLVELVLTFLPRHFVASDSVPTPETARAHAFIAVGKLCLRDEKLAKQCLTILARELHENLKDGCHKVQSNALLVLGDLCIRYTAMVDRYLPVMAACLQSGHAMDESILVTDKSAIVRKHAILLLSSLLLQDYIKWRGLLFHRFLVASADNDETVASIGKNILMGPLLTKCPKLFFNNFVESLFVLNRCSAHPIYITAASSGDGGGGIAVGFEGINLTGPAGRAKRFRMYDLMLSKMSDEEKIAVTARLAKEVLGSALSRGSDLFRVCTSPIASDKVLDRAYESAFNVLSDCLSILSSPALRVGKASQSNDEDNGIEDPNVPANASRRVIAAKGKLLSRISRKHLIEIVFPILCNLKTVLQKSCSPLLKDLMAYMVHIFRAYKAEVTDYLSNDPSLLQEIEYDAKKALKKTPIKEVVQEGEGSATPEAIGEAQED